MRIARSIDELRGHLAAWRAPAFVPTMGNLHAGHIHLVELAREHGDAVVASIFVNRLQFGPAEDFDTYPRTFEEDCARLEAGGCDLLFAPPESALYPLPQTFVVRPDPALADILEGAFRPGFFTGVATVVLKLFGCVQPKAAVFGEKDFQQLLVIRQLVEQFALDVRIVAAPIQRLPDGLAHSSRNGYLDAAERAEAPRLHVVLQRVAERAARGAEVAAIEAEGQAELAAHGWVPNYVAVRDAATLGPADGALQRVVLGAARLGRTRLIDNVRVAAG